MTFLQKLADQLRHDGILFARCRLGPEGAGGQARNEDRHQN
jgi:hypothetical protein